MGLKQYRKKRDVKKSGEPSGSKKSRSGDKPIFVIQKHDASSLHYDFRLEVDGVLKSWAVPKGPSTDPSDKRLAVETEDHPIEYADFEGLIPEGEYGAGTVMVWDRGHFKNLREETSMAKGFKEGQLEVWLEGEKLRGGYALSHFRTEGKQRQWLLIKMRDDEADARRNPVSTENKSVKSGRTMHQIEKEADSE